jgi:polysaccharide biosynthesis transport protein
MNSTHLARPEEPPPRPPVLARETTPAAYAPPQPPPQSFRDNEGLRFVFKLFGLLVKHWRLIAIVCALFCFGGAVVTFLSPRVYTATTTIQIDREAAKVVRNQDLTMDHGFDPQFYTTQYELLKSRALAERVAASLNLAEDPEFAGGGRKSWLGSLLRRAAASPDSGADAAARMHAAASAVRGGASIQPVPGSRIVRINFRASTPALAQKISIGLADNFVAMTLDRRFNASAYARGFLEEKLAQLKLKLEESERQVVAYAQREGIVNVDDKLPIAGANLKALNDALAAATADRIRKEQIWAQAQTGDAANLPQLLEDRLIQAAREKRGQLAADYQDKLRLMKPDFPEMQQLKAQIAEYDRQIRAQAEYVKRSIKAQYEAARDQEASFLKKLETLKVDVLDLRDRSIQYNILQREVDTNRSLYDGLLQQYKEVGVTGAVGTNNVQVIDRAELPGAPSSPSWPLNLVIALVLGVVVATVIVAIKEFLDDTFVVPEEAEQALGLSVLGVVPMAPTEDGAVAARRVLEEPHSAIGEAFRSLRTALQFTTTAGLPRALLVVSSQPGEGKSFTSLCLAANFAQLGMRVLLIDADLRKASLHKALGVANDAGLSDVLADRRKPADVVKEGLIPGVTFMPSGPLPHNPAELLAGPRFSSLLATATANFDFVLIDGPPVIGLADAPLLSSLVEASLLVVDSAHTRRRVVQAAVKRLQFARANLLGVLLNKYNSTKANQSYGYGYGHVHAYDDTYYSYSGPRERRDETGEEQRALPPEQ